MIRSRLHLAQLLKISSISAIFPSRLSRPNTSLFQISSSFSLPSIASPITFSLPSLPPHLLRLLISIILTTLHFTSRINLLILLLNKRRLFNTISPAMAHSISQCLISSVPIQQDGISFIISFQSSTQPLSWAQVITSLASRINFPPFVTDICPPRCLSKNAEPPHQEPLSSPQNN
jgi:hypothetical protein